MKCIYIALIKAHTGLGAVGRQITGFEYTHAAVCLDDTFTEFITFSRRRHYLPFDAGFMRETRSCYAFGKHKSFKAKIYRIPVNSEQLAEISRYIRTCENDGYIFNLISMATMPLLHGTHIYKARNCMSFCAEIAELAGVRLTKPFYKYSISGLDKALCKCTCFEGYIKKHCEDYPDKYMKIPTPWEYAQKAAELLTELARRIRKYGIRR
ncbi:MAG: hypothetical protein K2K57_14390 [Oscillospiraceae bacterium]|nr:hypothetical protein [Oscillospiraceae bacterium]